MWMRGGRVNRRQLRQAQLAAAIYRIVIIEELIQANPQRMLLDEYERLTPKAQAHHRIRTIKAPAQRECQPNDKCEGGAERNGTERPALAAVPPDRWGHKHNQRRSTPQPRAPRE